MNGFVHPGHLAALQHHDHLHNPQQYEIEYLLRMADEIRRAERKVQRQRDRAERRARRSLAIRTAAPSRRTGQFTGREVPS